jgi:hypothetical protein
MERKLAQGVGETALGRFYRKILGCSKRPFLIFPISFPPFSPFISLSLFLF